MISEKCEANSAYERGAISMLAVRLVRVRLKIVVVGAGIGLQVRVVAFPEKVVILIQQIRETHLDYLYLIAGWRDRSRGSGPILIIATENPGALNIIDTADYAEWISPQGGRHARTRSGESVVVSARTKHPSVL